MTLHTPRLLVAASGPPRLQRARGIGRVTFRRAGDQTRLQDLVQDGSAKIRLPRVYDGRGPVAVLLNTAGGITGGDHLVYEAEWGDGARATVTAQAAERIYRRSEGVGRVENRLVVGAGAEAFWLPQETIVFDRAGLVRTLEVDLAADARFTGCEMVVMGRTAMGEEVTTLSLSDRWRIRRGGRLVYADALRFEGDTRAILSGGATGRGARAFASVVQAAPDAAERLDAVRGVLDEACERAGGRLEAGVSAFDGLLAVRLLGADGRALRDGIAPLMEHLIGGALPRVWAL
ncbi:urease accessory protein UreD [Chthonobacter rhizosphaerae]|uniref:urease accessory protein UreD n=1 Tax=Chthonobacter rhizosphaerae TaxID=2735553 RepID=UPI0015EFABE4|nr:urease accessory protein UreD [Chthonobacter rhizosphaerae]